MKENVPGNSPEFIRYRAFLKFAVDFPDVFAAVYLRNSFTEKGKIVIMNGSIFLRYVGL